MFGQRTMIFVKEQVALMKLRDTYDLLCPETGQPLGQVRDEPEAWAKWMRLLVKKALLPTTLNVYGQGGGMPLLQVRKGPAFFRTRLEVRDGQGRLLLQLRSRFFSLGGSFDLLDATGQAAGELRGDWKGWNYEATLAGAPLGQVTKKWAGLLREVFTNADRYLVVSQRPEQLPLMLGLALAVDLVYKERQG